METTTLIIDADLNKLMAAAGALRVVQRNTPGPYRLVGIGGGTVLVALLLSGHNETLEKRLRTLNNSDHGLRHPSALQNWLKSHVLPIPLNELDNNFLIGTNLKIGHPIIFPNDALKWDLSEINLIDAIVFAARPPWLVDETYYFICDGRLCNHEAIEMLSTDTTIHIFTEIDPSTPLHGLGAADFQASIQAGQHAQALRNRLSHRVKSALWDQMIVIHTDICPTQPRLSPAELEKLQQTGVDAARKWYAVGFC
jgi:hypothetical protein